MVTSSGTMAGGRAPTQGVAVQVPQIKPRDRKRALLITAAVAVVSALLLVLGLQSYTSRTPVMVANKTIERGQVIAESDLKVVEVSGSGSLNSFDDAEGLVGKIATTSLSEGDVLSTSVVSDSIGIEEGHSVSGLVVGPGQFPTKDLKPGDLVDILAAGSPEKGGGDKLASGVRVFAVLPPEEVGSSTDLLVSVVLDDDEASAVAAQVEQPGGVRLTLRGGK